MALEFDRLICRSRDGEVGSAFSGGNIRNFDRARQVKSCGVLDTPKWFLSFHVSPLTNEDIENNPDWGTTDLTRSLFMFYVRPLTKATPVLHLGAGAGLYHFDGQGSADRTDERYKSYQAVIPVRVRLTPLAAFSESQSGCSKESKCPQLLLGGRVGLPARPD